MTSIREFLDPYDAPGEWANPAAKRKYEMSFGGQGASLAAYLESLGTTDPGWAFFNYTLRARLGRHPFDNSAVHPDDVIAACGYLGFTDVEPLVDWVNSIRSGVAGGMAEKLALNSTSIFELPAYSTRQTIQFNGIIDALKASGANIQSGAVLHATDDEYPGITQDELQRYIRECDPCRGMVWTPQVRDCDDFAQVFQAGLKARGYGNCRICYIEMTLWAADNQCTGAHACNAIVFADGTAMLIEPQNYTLYPMNAVWLGGGISGASVRNEIYWVSA